MPGPDTRLEQLLAALPPALPLVMHAGARISAAALLADAEALRSARPMPTDGIVSLHSDDAIGFITGLVAWDGYARALLLMPPDVATANIPDLPDTPATTLWYLFTSGTTNIPKAIPHTFASLTRTSKRHVPGAPAHRWGLAYDPARFAGLQVVLQALLGGSSLVPGVTGDFETSVAAFVAHGIDALSATPTYWRKLLMHRGILDCPLRHITLGGEIADQAILDALARAFPAARIRHIYASTEAGVGFSVSDGRAGFPTDYLRNGWAGTRLRVDADGTLWLCPEKPLTASPARETDALGYLNSHDRVEAQDDRFYFVGRDTGVINVGGNKVFPEEVEQVLREVDGVHEARVGAQTSSIAGQLVVAEIVPAPDVDRAALRQAILAHCRTRLARHKVPAIVKWRDQFDMTQSGKLARHGGPV